MFAKEKPLSLDAARKKLERVYKLIPETTGCLDNINKEGGCEGVCCKFQSPQVLYVEFLNAWDHILKIWSAEDIIDIVSLSLKTYLSNKPTKGCIFWNPDTKQCRQYETRCLSCRLYSIVPEEEFHARYEQVKEMLKDKPDAIIMPQCDLVKTVDGRDITTAQTDFWWDELIKIEMFIGVPRQSIHDRFGGSYRTYHDHLLIHLFIESIMQNLSTIRVNGTEEEKEKVVEKLTDHFRERIYSLSYKLVEDGKAKTSNSS